MRGGLGRNTPDPFDIDYDAILSIIHIKMNAAPHESETELPGRAAFERMAALFAQGRHEQSLDICLQLMRTHPKMVNAISSAAANCIMLRRWQEAVDYAQTALARGRKTLPVYDALASACGEL
ncbi:MAG: hypothetical protein LBH10_04080, partial [Burkholderiaceae bacterium]|nr:hypothetical protein [Burkholderiaceae bacterium]